MTTKEPLLHENQQLRERVAELEETVHAIRRGEVDALISHDSGDDQIFIQPGALNAYRMMVEAMSDGAVTLAQDGSILYCNDYFVEMIGIPHGQIIGMSFGEMVSEQQRNRFDQMMAQSLSGNARGELMLRSTHGKFLPVYLSMQPLREHEGSGVAIVVTDLTEVVAATEAQSRLALIIESSDDAIISTTLDGVVQTWNRSAEKLFGYSAKEAIGQMLQTLIVPNEYEDELAREFDSIRHGKPVKYNESVRLHKDGSPINVSIAASPVKDAEQKIIGGSINLRDISEKVHAREELNASYDLLKNVVENTPLRVFWKDTKMRFLGCNTLFAHDAGMAHPEEVIGKDDFQMAWKDLAERYRADDQQVIETGERKLGYEEPQYRPDGSVTWLRTSKVPLRTSEGVIIGMLGIYEDITESRQTQEDLKLFRALIDHANDAIEVLDPDTLRFLDVNATECRRLGYSREELLSMSVFDISPTLDEATLTAFGQDIQKTDKAHLEGEHQRKDGSMFPVEVNASLIHLDKPYLLSIVRDITKRKQIEDKLHSTLHDLGERLKEMNCLYDISTLVRDDALSVEQIIQSVVETIPAAMQHPEVTCARINLEDKQYKSADFKKTSWRLAASLGMNGEAVGDIEVFYRKKMPDHNVGPFLNEEIALVEGIAQTLTNFLKRRRAETALKKSEKEFHVLTESMPQIVWVARPDGYNIYFNQRWVDYTGLTQGEGNGYGWNKSFHPDDQKRAWDEWKNATENAGTYSLEGRLRGADGVYRWWLIRGYPLRDDRGDILKWFGTCTDIHDLKTAEQNAFKANRALRTLSAGNEALVRATTEETLLQAATDVIVEQSSYELAEVCFAEDNPEKSLSLMAWAACAEETYLWVGHPTWADTKKGQLPISRAIRLGKPQICQDIATGDMYEPWRKAALARGYVSNIALPLMKGSLVFGALSIYSSDDQAFDDDEVALLEELANDLAYGIVSLRIRKEHDQHTAVLHQSLEQSILAIADTVEARDPYTAGHQRRVAELATAIAREMGLTEDQINGLYLAAIIHDLGKIHIPAEILSKPGQLSDIEYMLIQTHPQAGYDILKNVEFPWPIAEMVLQHHEKLDGTGYPQGLKSEQILLESKILTVADVVEAMSSHRPYRASLGIEIALDDVKKGRGIKYDAKAVDACLKLFFDKGFQFS